MVDAVGEREDVVDGLPERVRARAVPLLQPGDDVARGGCAGAGVDLPKRGDRSPARVPVPCRRSR